jgi:transcriptional regulator with XRE-family HTH domain
MYADLIRELKDRSNLQVNEYAERIDVTPTHLSTILNGKQPGSRKILENALADAHLTLGDLELPERETNREEAKRALRLFHRLTPEQRDAIMNTMQLFVAAPRARKVRTAQRGANGQTTTTARSSGE